jgi:hypothetical protein
MTQITAPTNPQAFSCHAISSYVRIPTFAPRVALGQPGKIKAGFHLMFSGVASQSRFRANCGKRLEVDDGVAGKKAKCKQCGHIFVIPTPRAVTPQPVGRRPSSRRDEDDSWSAAAAPKAEDPFDRYGLDEPMAAPKPSAITYAPSYADDEEPPAPKRIGPAPSPTREESSGSRWSSGRREFWDGIPGPMYMVMFGAVAFTAGLAIVIPSTGMLLLIAAGASFLILWLYAALGMLVLPWQESAACGLMCMFVPFYALYYLITRWDTMKGPFLSGLAAYGIVMVAAIGLPAANAAQMAAQRAAAREQLAQPVAAVDDDAPAVAQDAADEPPTIPAPRWPAFGARKRPTAPRRGGAGPRSPGPGGQRPGTRFPTPDGQPPGPGPGFPGLATPPPTGGPNVITVIVTGINGQQAGKAFGDKLTELVMEISTGYQLSSSVGGGKSTYQITPLNPVDVKTFADQITWAKVTRVRGRTIEVDASVAADNEQGKTDSP